MTDLRKENLVGLTAAVWEATTFGSFYSNTSDGTGWIGVILFLTEAGDAFTDAEALHDPDYIDVDWYRALDLFATYLTTYDYAALGQPSQAELLDAAFTIRLSLSEDF